MVSSSSRAVLGRLLRHLVALAGAPLRACWYMSPATPSSHRMSAGTSGIHSTNLGGRTSTEPTVSWHALFLKGQYTPKSKVHIINVVVLVSCGDAVLLSEVMEVNGTKESIRTCETERS